MFDQSEQEQAQVTKRNENMKAKSQFPAKGNTGIPYDELNQLYFEGIAAQSRYK